MRIPPDLAPHDQRSALLLALCIAVACSPKGEERPHASSDAPVDSRPSVAFDTAAVERAADSVRVIRVSPAPLNIRVGERVPLPRAWAFDSLGNDVVGFVPLWFPPNDSIVGREGSYLVARRAGQTEMRVRPMRRVEVASDVQAHVVISVRE